jgi:hypothetical protein
LNRTDLAYRRSTDLDRATRAVQGSELPWGWLAIINSSAPISGSSYRFLYTWTEATFAGTTPYAPTAKTGGMTGSALSVSELGNNGTRYSYGVLASTLPAGFLPKAIPNNTPVWIVPFRAVNGAELYLIVNTQAIDGVCP